MRAGWRRCRKKTWGDLEQAGWMDMDGGQGGLRGVTSVQGWTRVQGGVPPPSTSFPLRDLGL